MQCEAVLLGREAVEGAVDAAAMAVLIRSLLAARERISRNAGDVYRDRRRYLLRCRDGVELLPSPRSGPPSSAASTASSSSGGGGGSRPRRVDDEGFESDDDTASTKSAASLDDTVSNSSSCCFVDDHVFKFPAGSRGAVNSTSSSSSVATDSANSSGASDTDDVDSSSAPSPSAGSVAKLVQSLSLFQRGGAGAGAGSGPGSSGSDSARASPMGGPAAAGPGEAYSVSDVAFCHLDPAFPKVVVWVVKRRRAQRLTAAVDGHAPGLEAIVLECTNERALKKLCTGFQEISRRAKLDQYKHPHRRKDLPFLSLAATSATLHAKPFLRGPAESAARIKPEPPAKPAKLPEVKPAAFLAPPAPRPKPAAKPLLPKVAKEEELPAAARFNLVQRTDGDGVTHIEVSRGGGAADGAIPVETIPDGSGPSSIISISTPDSGNLLAAGGTRASRLDKEIEAVIRGGDSLLDPARREAPRQRQPAILVTPGDTGAELHKVWSPPQPEPEDDEDQRDAATAAPPQRPERRKYVRKKAPAPQPPAPGPAPAPAPDPAGLAARPPTALQQKIVRGQFIRVSVDQAGPGRAHQPWLFGGSGGYLGTWSSPEAVARERLPWRGLDDMFAVQGHAAPQHQRSHRRSRSSGGRSRSKSPPAVRRPMAYRYIDVAGPPPPSPSPSPGPGPGGLSSRFFGLSQKLRELGSGQQSPYSTALRRRGSGGETGGGAGHNGNLKSVIKKTKKAGEYVEPKKVTFSAYATVQVVD